jgi:hypothetical protein
MTACGTRSRLSAPRKTREDCTAGVPHISAHSPLLPTGCPNPVDSRRLTSTGGEREPTPFAFRFTALARKVACRKGFVQRPTEGSNPSLSAKS